MNLGDKLKAANEARALEKSTAEIRAREENRQKYEANARIIRNFITAAIETISGNIENGITVKAVTIPDGDPFNTYKWKGDMIDGFSDTYHPNYSSLQAFFDWASENGLIGKFQYQHDGVGIKSWYVATVTPKG